MVTGISPSTLGSGLEEGGCSCNLPCRNRVHWILLIIHLVSGGIHVFQVVDSSLKLSSK